MSLSLPLVRQAIAARPWAIMPERAADIAAVIERRAAGVRLPSDAIAALKGPRYQPNGTVLLRAVEAGAVIELDPVAAAAGNGPAASGGAVAVINLFGIVAQHASQVDDISGPGGVSTERVGASLRAALADPGVKAIILNIDSPGGSCAGVQELADAIFQARGQKPIVAVANSLAASAAYWIASAADEVVAAPGALLGSIGAYILHEDASAMVEGLGLKYTFVSAGKFKVEGNSFEPLGPEAKDALQVTVDAYYKDFVRAVARGRGVSSAEVVNGFGEGRVLKDGEAVRAGLADKVATLDTTIQRLLRGKRGGGAAAEEPRPITLQACDGATYLVGEWPNTTEIAHSLLHSAHAFGMQLSAAEIWPGTIAKFTLANAEAEYEIETTDALGPGLDWTARLGLVWGRKTAPAPQEESDAPAAPDAPEEPPASPAASDTDHFRRRRHARRHGG